MKPIISTTGKSTQLRYELPHRVHDAKIYPVKAPNGSTIILYGHETGVGILWRGGRPIKKTTPPPPKQPAKPPKVNGTSSDTIMIIDSDDDEPPAKTTAPAPPPAEFEDEEEELDPDQPYPSIIQQLRISLNTEVLHIAVPQIPLVSPLRAADTVPAIFSSKIVFTVACADYSVRIITVPLSPPSNAAKEAPASAKSQHGEECVKIAGHAGHQSVPRGIAMTWTARAEPTFSNESDDDMDVDDGVGSSVGRRPAGGRRRSSRSQAASREAPQGWDLLIASHSTDLGGLLRIHRLQLAETSLVVKKAVSSYQTMDLRSGASAIAFNSAQYPKRRHSQLLITDNSGLARIYDPFASRTKKRRTSAEPELGAYVALFRSTFDRTQSHIPAPPILAGRKPIIDATWASDGHSIFALLADGEWGIWDVGQAGPKPPSNPSSFSARGFVGTSPQERSSSGASSPKRNSRGSLAPMTPNTRRTKQENLFQGSPSSSSTPPRGSISIASLSPTDGGVPEDTVMIHYGAEVHKISNLAQFWSKAVSGSSGNPTKLQGISLFGEVITSIDQFETTAENARKAVPRDVLITTDHRLIIATTAAQPLGRDLNAEFQEQTHDQEIRRTDQALLADGDLDLGGMDRLMEDMEGSGSRSLVLGNPRKVLFASSTA